jgi:hypothetical protein
MTNHTAVYDSDPNTRTFLRDRNILSDNLPASGAPNSMPMATVVTIIPASVTEYPYTFW